MTAQLAHAHDSEEVIDPEEISRAIHLAMLEQITRTMPDIAQYVEENAGNIVNEFRGMAGTATTQAENIESVLDLTKFVRVGDETIPFERCIDVLYQPLTEAMDNILSVSKLAMQMVVAVSKAADNIKRVEKFINEIQDITKQTNMLAMNTQIEAARAGEAGKSFQFIAGEVKNLSQDIKSLSEAMQVDIHEVSEAVKESSKVVDSLANYNMVGNLSGKERVDSVVEAIRSQNNQYSALLENAVQMNRENAHNMNRMVLNIQFQDRTNQIIGDWIGILLHVQQYLRTQLPTAASQITSSHGDDVASSILADVKLSDIRRQFVASLYERSVLGYESELVKKHVVEGAASSTGATAFSSDEGDIELF